MHCFIVADQKIKFHENIIILALFISFLPLLSMRDKNVRSIIKPDVSDLPKKFK
jgi:hypothetical protein